MKPEYEKKEYDIETGDETAFRMDMLIRQMYYHERDADLTGFCDHETLKRFTDSILYSTLEWEKRIAGKSRHKPGVPPEEVPKMHGLSRPLLERFKKNLDMYYDDLRTKVKTRLNRNGKVQISER